MNRYTIVCRLRWPAILLLTGVIALLDQMDLLTWGHAWPLYLILFGVLALAERAALASQPIGPPFAGYPAGYPVGYSAGNPVGNPGQAYQPYQPVATAPAASAPASTSIVPVSTGLAIEENDASRQQRKSWDEEGR